MIFSPFSAFLLGIRKSTKSLLYEWNFFFSIFWHPYWPFLRERKILLSKRTFCVFFERKYKIRNIKVENIKLYIGLGISLPTVSKKKNKVLQFKNHCILVPTPCQVHVYDRHVRFRITINKKATFVTIVSIFSMLVSIVNHGLNNSVSFSVGLESSNESSFIPDCSCQQVANLLRFATLSDTLLWNNTKDMDIPTLLYLKIIK